MSPDLINRLDFLVFAYAITSVFGSILIVIAELKDESPSSRDFVLMMIGLTLLHIVTGLTILNVLEKTTVQ